MSGNRGKYFLYNISFNFEICTKEETITKMFKLYNVT